MKVFLVFGSDLAHEKSGRVVLGPDTKKACDVAIGLCSHAGNGSSIIAVAGNAPLVWNHVWMAGLMMDYVREKNSKMHTIREIAETFDTFGQAKKFAEVVHGIHRPKVSQAVIVAKEWHMRRARMLCGFWFAKMGLQVSIGTEDYKSEAGFMTRVVREYFVLTKDRARMARA